MNLIETNHKINMASYHSASRNNSFKRHLNANSFNMFLTLQQLSEAQFPYFVLPHLTTRHHKYWINQTICQAKPTTFIIKLYTGLNTLWVKHDTHQKAGSLRASSLSILSLLIFGYNHPNNRHYKYFSYLSKLANSGCAKRTGSQGVL